VSNFSFLKPEFSTLFGDAVRAEELCLSDARGSCFYARRALESAVEWLYENDSSLERPYGRELNVKLTDSGFRKLVGDTVFEKARAIQKMGNLAVHGNRPVMQYDAQRICQELFHVLYWLARTYTRRNPKELVASWNPALLITGHLKVPVLTQDELKEKERQRNEQLAAQEARLKERDEALAAKDGALSAVNVELERLRRELDEAKQRNLAVPETHDYNEVETRRLIIDLLLREVGWIVGEGRDVSVEYPVTGMPNEKGEGYADYVLWGDDGKPLAVVEAKRTMKDAHVGQQQAKLYADCLEKMKGQRPVIFYTNGYTTWMWDDTMYPSRPVQGFYKKEELQLLIQRRTMRRPLSGASVDERIVDRYYQKRVIGSLCESFSMSQRKGLLAMATGTGKTRTVIALVELLMRHNWLKRVLFLADRTALVKQAVNAFKVHLPDSSPVNLVTDRASTGRVYVSTYHTMMGLIDKMESGERKFGVGHFDLIIIDEAHRSVYQKFKTIFDYFDSLLVGLTATPRDEVHHDTYDLFDLETGVPTDSYDLATAVKDHYLVPTKAVTVPLKLQREGIHYNELNEDEKERWDNLEWDEEDGAPSDVDGEAINKWLFNRDTVDKVLKHLMERGLKGNSGDRLGKTIIFAKNHNHAQFIAERFNAHYPHLKGEFARVIDNYNTYAQSLIDDFYKPDGPPFIAISVDMMDTGLDVPEVVNLVFFKVVRSKTKFFQMVGRGTRLCPNLFGPGLDKQFFYIFDFCGNLEFFQFNPDGVEGSLAEPLSTRLFKNRVLLIDNVKELLRSTKGEEVRAALAGLSEGICNQLHGEVTSMNVDNFIVRPHREYVERFSKREEWADLDNEKIGELMHHVAGLPTELPEEDITAKLFDLTVLNLQLSLIEKSHRFEAYQKRVVEIAVDLSEKESIPMVKEQMGLIQALQTDEWWQGVTLPMLEVMRKKLRDLVKFTDRRKRKPLYGDFTDVMGEESEIEIPGYAVGVDLVQYEKKVRQFLKDKEDHIVIHKLRQNEPLTPSDLSELERLLFKSGELQGREQFEECFGKQPRLSVFIRGLVGLDREAAKQAFSRFLSGHTVNANQIRFIDLIVDHLTKNGIMPPEALYEPPFTLLDTKGIDGLFKSAEVEDLFGTIETVNRNAEAG